MRHPSFQPAERDLAVHLVRFARRLRWHGVEVAIGDEIDAGVALRLIDIGDPQEVRFALRTALKIDRHDWDLFDTLFEAFWTQGRGGDHPMSRRRAVGREASRRRGAQPPAMILRRAASPQFSVGKEGDRDRQEGGLPG